MTDRRLARILSLPAPRHGGSRGFGLQVPDGPVRPDGISPGSSAMARCITDRRSRGSGTRSGTNPASSPCRSTSSTPKAPFTRTCSCIESRGIMGSGDPESGSGTSWPISPGSGGTGPAKPQGTSSGPVVPANVSSPRATGAATASSARSSITSRTAAPARHGQLPGPADATRRPVRHARGVIQTPECIPRRQRFASASSLA